MISRKNMYEPNEFITILSKINNIYKAGKA